MPSLSAVSEEVDLIVRSYQALVAEADQLFTRVRSQFPQAVTCSCGCSDCCHALFDLSFIEAYSLNKAFTENIPYGPLRSHILTAAGEADRQATKMKRHYYELAKQGMNDEDILAEASRQRLRCPLLADDGACLMYNYRPITCRLYGIPTAVNGKAHVCHRSAFGKGAYPTVALDRIQDKLALQSRQLIDAMHSKFQLHQVYVPVSMALLTTYDDEYLGIKK